MADGDRISAGLCAHVILVRRNGLWWPTDAFHGAGVLDFYTDEQVETEFDPNNADSRCWHRSMKYEPMNGG